MTTEEATSASASAPAAEEHEDPSLSSASLCIRFNLLGETFRPVFTHQAFPGEGIRGYHPPLSVLKEWTDKATAVLEKPDPSFLLHSSHKHHEGASKELSITVNLSPSCEECQVDISTDHKRLPRRQSVRASKRRKINETTTSENDNENGKEEQEEPLTEEKKEINVNDNESASEPEDFDDDEEEKDDDSEFEADGEVSETEQEVDKEGFTRKSRMPTKEILRSMKKGLPSVTEKTKITNEGFLRRPLGVELQEYSVKGKDYVLCLATGEEAAKYHKQVQRLALWFIETADDVDVSSKEGGFWKVVYLFQKHKRTQYSLAGYTTLFHFHAPFKKPKAGYVVRICQALVLPPYQRAGHGKKMLICVMDIAHGAYANKLSTDKKGGTDETVETNVESPAPAFVMLRNRTDYDCFLKSIESKNPWFPASSKAKVTDDGFFSSLPESDVVQAAAKAKIIPRQIQIVQELYKLHQLQEHYKIEGEDQKDELDKRFRLMVKKRLNKEHREDLSGFRTKAEKQAFLEALFKKCLEDYHVTLPKV